MYEAFYYSHEILFIASNYAHYCFLHVTMLASMCNLARAASSQAASILQFTSIVISVALFAGKANPRYTQT